jgi:hypothetical protein
LENATSDAPKPASRASGRRPRQPDRPAQERAPGYAAPELTAAQQREKTRLLSRFRFFAKRWQNWQGVWYYEQPHDEMCDELDEMVPRIGAHGARNKKIYLAPRYTYKTSLLLCFMAFLFLKFREEGIEVSIDYVRAACDLAEEVLFELKMHLTQNPLVLEYWGDLSRAAYLWSGRKINFGRKRDATVSVSGLDRGASGKHPDIVIFDDIVNEKNFDSVIAKRKARMKLNAYEPIIPLGWGVMIHAGTRFAFNDVSGWLLDKNAAARRKRDTLIAQGRIDEAREVEEPWKEYIRAYDDGPGGKGTAFFPAQLPIEAVDKLRDDGDIDPRLWAAWYKNECYAEGMQLFRPEYLHWFTAHYSPRSKDDLLVPTLEVMERVTRSGQMFPVEHFPVRVTMTIDPTTTANRKSDRTGITVVATDHRNWWWVLLAVSLFKVPSEVGDAAVQYIARFVPDVVLIESAQADVEMVTRIRDGIVKLGVPTMIKSYRAQVDETAGERGVVGKRQKIRRIEALEPRFRRRDIRLAAGQCDALEQQYRHWPDVDHDDVMDALAMQHVVARACRWATLDEAEIGMRPEEEDEERGDIWRQYSVMVTTVGGEQLKITVSPERDDEDDYRLIGKAGLASQRVRVGGRR